MKTSLTVSTTSTVKLIFSLLIPFSILFSAPSQKKGSCINVKNTNYGKIVTSLHATWFYTWGSDYPAQLAPNVKFTPMIWGPNSVQKGIANILELKQKKLATEMLGFNEPDHARQSVMTPEQAIALWPELEKINLRLGSPVPARNTEVNWLTDFMKQAEASNYRVDFVAVHWYGGGAVTFLQVLEKTYEKYHKPLWITEFALADFDAVKKGKSRYTKEDGLQFMKEVLPRLEELPYVERYAWYSSPVEDIKYDCSVLFSPDGTLTELGQFYANF
jgi:hypothetical protein